MDKTQRNKWLKERKKGIGGSDACAILGLSKYRTPVDVWLDKLDKPNPMPNEIPEHLAWYGHAMEPIITKRFEEETGFTVRGSNYSAISKKYPYVRGTVDGAVFNSDQLGIPMGILEIKTTTNWSFKNAKYEVPIDWYVQLQHYLLLHEKEQGWVAWVSDRKFGWKKFEANKDLHEKMLKKYEVFWDHVENEKEPPPANSDDIFKIHPDSNGKEKIATPDIALEIEYIKSIKYQIKDLEAIREGHEEKVKEFFGDDEIIIDSEGNKLGSWKTIESNRFSSKEFKKDHKELYNAYKRKSKYRRLYL